MSNIINAICELINNPITDLQASYLGKNRINNVGDALERYVQDLFIGGFYLSEYERTLKIAEHFSYLGNASNPPDMMLKNGDAIEVKKIENKNSDLALNSSYPKAKLFSNNPMLTTACKTAENWMTKDMLYAVGIVNNGQLTALALVYGDDYCAEAGIYETIKNRIKTGVETIEGVEFTATKELGKIKRIDPLGITNLRVRGMWHIENPFKVFDDVYQRDFRHRFNFMAIINDEKWQSLDNTNELLDTISHHQNASITDILLKIPITLLN
ncbi:NgoPII family restriction endonuclease [Moraxella equi]|uniref:Restriction endonuclease n=1 Tax=Moraxella equi TaxID=60442 RepID=A0A378QUR3_9GAMM|nr:NgoPII family restriction endonuclease [Moraxella equi]OPH37809.1 restriction endonuclease [Moraxella equi]STZ03163.1 NgoPII restriction endonuclease [Moraxella equi]